MTWHIEDHTHMCKLDMECVELIHHMPPGDRLKATWGLECAWFYHSCSDLECPAVLIIWLFINVPLVCQWACGERTPLFQVFWSGNDAPFLFLSHSAGRKIVLSYFLIYRPFWPEFKIQANIQPEHCDTTGQEGSSPCCRSPGKIKNETKMTEEKEIIGNSSIF